MSRICLNLEHRVLKALRGQDLPRRWLLAVSGGLDSMVLAEILWRWRRYLKAEIKIAHVHHGSDANLEFRNQAQRLVRKWAAAHKVHFITNPPRARKLKSEAELRGFRLHELERWRRKLKMDLVVFAHHRDDLLETRLLRLIRGTGMQGLSAMRLHSACKLRPLLGITRAELEQYARARDLEWVEDPSNSASDAFRNWLRREWLPHLETRQKGALKSLARSLENLSPDDSESRLGAYVGLRRKDISQVSSTRQQTVVAEYLRALGLRGYGRGHIEEILKRLKTRRGEFSFEMLGFCFRVTPDLVWASRV